MSLISWSRHLIDGVNRGFIPPPIRDGASLWTGANSVNVVAMIEFSVEHNRVVMGADPFAVSARMALQTGPLL